MDADLLVYYTTLVDTLDNPRLTRQWKKAKAQGDRAMRELFPVIQRKHRAELLKLGVLPEHYIPQQREDRWFPVEADRPDHVALGYTKGFFHKETCHRVCCEKLNNW